MGRGALLPLLCRLRSPSCPHAPPPSTHTLFGCSLSLSLFFFFFSPCLSPELALATKHSRRSPLNTPLFDPRFQTNTNYDRGVNTFNPEGRLFQVEYAIEAIKLGTTAIGIKCAEGVVLAVEKRITSPLIEPSSLKKLLEIDSHVGCAMSGSRRRSHAG